MAVQLSLPQRHQEVREFLSKLCFQSCLCLLCSEHRAQHQGYLEETDVICGEQRCKTRVIFYSIYMCLARAHVHVCVGVCGYVFIGINLKNKGREASLLCSFSGDFVLPQRSPFQLRAYLTARHGHRPGKGWLTHCVPGTTLGRLHLFCGPGS